MSNSESLAVCDALFRFLSAQIPGTIATYRAMGDEVVVSSLVGRLPGWRWLLPRIEPDGSLTWRDARVTLEKHRWGMEQPMAEGQIIKSSQIDSFLVPGLAFDAVGNRLGRGRGYYDRELATRRGDSLAIGVTVGARLLDSIPIEEHDQPVTHLATEMGVIEATPTK